jgi:hypothetical protein
MNKNIKKKFIRSSGRKLYKKGGKHTKNLGTNFSFSTAANNKAQSAKKSNYEETRSANELMAASLKYEDTYKGIYQAEDEQYTPDMHYWEGANVQPSSEAGTLINKKMLTDKRKKYPSVMRAKGMMVDAETGEWDESYDAPGAYQDNVQNKDREWTYNEAFAFARNNGLKHFTLNGKKYDTRYAEETPEQFERSFIIGTPEYNMRMKDQKRRSNIRSGTSHQQGPYQNSDWQKGVNYVGVDGNKQGWRPDYNRDRMEYGEDINELAGPITPRGQEGVLHESWNKRGVHGEGAGTMSARTKVEPVIKSKLEKEQSEQGTYRYYDNQGNVMGGTGIESTPSYVRPQTEEYYGPNEQGHIVPFFRNGGRRKYQLGGGNMYGSNVMPGAAIPSGNFAAYEQSTQAEQQRVQEQLNRTRDRDLEEIAAKNKQQADTKGQLFGQTAQTLGSELQGTLENRGKLFGKTAEQMTESQYGEGSLTGKLFKDKIGPGGEVLQTGAERAQATGAQMGSYGAVANLAGQGISAMADDQDATTYTGGEIAGSALSGMGKGAAMGAQLGSIIPGVGNVIGAGAGAVIGGVSSVIKGKKLRDEAIDEKQDKEREIAQLRNRQATLRAREKEYSGADVGIARYGGKRMFKGGGRRLYKKGGVHPVNFYSGGGPLKHAGAAKYSNGGPNQGQVVDFKNIPTDLSFNPITGYRKHEEDDGHYDPSQLSGFQNIGDRDFSDNTLQYLPKNMFQADMSWLNDPTIARSDRYVDHAANQQKYHDEHKKVANMVWNMSPEKQFVDEKFGEYSDLDVETMDDDIQGGGFFTQTYDFDRRDEINQQKGMGRGYADYLLKQGMITPNQYANMLKRVGDDEQLQDEDRTTLGQAVNTAQTGMDYASTALIASGNPLAMTIGGGLNLASSGIDLAQGYQAQSRGDIQGAQQEYASGVVGLLPGPKTGGKQGVQHMVETIGSSALKKGPGNILGPFGSEPDQAFVPYQPTQPIAMNRHGGHRKLYPKGGYKDKVDTSQFFDESGNYIGYGDKWVGEGAGRSAPGHSQANPFGITVPEYDMSVYEGYSPDSRIQYSPTSGSIGYIKGESPDDRSKRQKIHHENWKKYNQYRKDVSDANKWHSGQKFTQGVSDAITDTKNTWESMEGDPWAKSEYIVDRLGYLPVVGSGFGILGGAMNIGEAGYHLYHGDKAKALGSLVEGGTDLLFSSIGPGGRAIKGATNPIRNMAVASLTEGIENKVAKNLTKTGLNYAFKHGVRNPYIKDPIKQRFSTQVGQYGDILLPDTPTGVDDMGADPKSITQAGPPKDRKDITRMGGKRRLYARGGAKPPATSASTDTVASYLGGHQLFPSGKVERKYPHVTERINQANINLGGHKVTEEEFERSKDRLELETAEDYLNIVNLQRNQLPWWGKTALTVAGLRKGGPRPYILRQLNNRKFTKV